MTKKIGKTKPATTPFSGLLQPLRAFATDLKHKFALPGTANPEDQLKGPVGNLAKEAGAVVGLSISTRTEAHLSEHGVRPDVAVYSAGLICGYIELKAPGIGADAPKLKGKHNKEQWEKLKNVPNLIYTDGREWSLYRNGDRVGALVRFDSDPAEDGQTSITTDKAEALHRLLRNFLFWTPQVPHKADELAKYLAPLTRLLRNEVELTLQTSDSNVGLLAKEWRQYFFPEADDAQFADAYAQTVTYALLLARLHGESKLEPQLAAKALNGGNNVLALALDRLGQPGAKDELRTSFELLQRSLEALEPAEFLKTKPDLWLYFYEDFLAAYDEKLRKDYGVYYTPRQVVELQVRLAPVLLEKRFKRKLGFADDGVVFLDPAVGTGTYLVAAIDHGLKKVAARSGAGAVGGRASLMAENMYGFEILVGPYAVAHLRLTQAIEGAGGILPPEKRLRVFLADTLESPNASPPGGLTLTYKALTQEHEAARQVKRGGEILVCLGNPPYDRERRAEDGTKANKGGWVRFGDKGQGKMDLKAATVESGDSKERPIFEDFLAPARNSGKGLHLQVIFNDYVYFWRWALWRLFEQQNCGGIVSFITASSYLSGPGFVGMREVMRRTFDELWFLDLGGDNLGARKTPNVFAIQIPVAIAIGTRAGAGDPNKPANAWYTKIEAPTREAKLKLIEGIESFVSIEWKRCDSGWQAPLIPKGGGAYFEWPKLTDIFPYHTAGAVFYRTWPIGESRDVLLRRWETLRSSGPSERTKLFKETRDRKTLYTVRTADLPGYGEPPIRDLKPTSHEPNCLRYGYRVLDQRFAYYDCRVGDYIRPGLSRLASDKQLFLVAPDSLVQSLGPSIVASANIPDQHYFRGSFGGRDVIPLYRNACGSEPNVTRGFFDRLAEAYGISPSAEDLAAYVYAVLGGQSYTSRFWNELETPGPRVPLTKERKLFTEAAALGRRLIWLHTYGERFRPDDEATTGIAAGSARAIKGIPSEPAKYPETFDYDPIAREIRVGEGCFGPVFKDTWGFEVSGLRVVQSWLAYRMKDRAGKKSSPLDDIRPERWTPKMTDELLELLWVLEATLLMEPALSSILDAVVKGECFLALELPVPTEVERELSKAEGEEGELLGIMEGDAREE